METVNAQQDVSVSSPLLVDKAFFGKDSCLTLQLRAGACYMKWGKKQSANWDWKSVKFADVELGEILRVLEGEVTTCSFYHSFNKESTQIRFSRNDDGLLCSAGEYARKLNNGEQKVLAILLRNIVWMMHVPGIA